MCYIYIIYMIAAINVKVLPLFCLLYCSVLHHGEYERQDPKSPDEMYVYAVSTCNRCCTYSSASKIFYQAKCL